MDLWIRSQDREILRVNPELEIYENNNKRFLIIDTKGSSDYYVAKVLGQYKTKERALEVLDEIQKILQPKGIIKFDGILDIESQKKVSKMLDNKYLIFNNNVELLQQTNTFVYEMPKE